MRRCLGAAILLAASLALASCYELEREVIPLAAGEVVTDLKESGALGDRSFRVGRSGQGNDYRFTETFRGRSRLGSFRATRMQGDLWLMQSRYDGDAFFTASFWRVGVGGAVTRLEPRGDVAALAERHGVARDGDVVRGPPANVLAFLRAHVNLNLVAAD
jgi:hypothetical protein